MSKRCFLLVLPIAMILSLVALTNCFAKHEGGSGVSSTSVGKFKFAGFTVKGNDVTIVTLGTPRLRITVTSPQTVRVWFEEKGKFVKEPSYAVVSEQWPAIDFSVTDQGSYIRILTANLSVRINKKPIRIDFFKADDTTLISADDQSKGMGFSSDNSRFVYRLMGPSEHFYGLGQDNAAYLGNLDRRGSVRTLWTGQQINKGRVTAEIPVPFFMSTGELGGGYGMFFDNTYRTEFNMGKESDSYFSWKAGGGKLLYYFIYGPSFNKIIEQYTSLTGRPSMPPLWTLGYIQSKCTYYTWPEMDEVVSNMRQKQIPLDAMVIDYDWPDQLQNFKWNKRWNGQSPAKLKEYAAAGVKVMISNSGPMIRKESSNYQDGLAAGIFATDGKGSTVTCGHYGGDLMDFTAPNMKAWLWPQLRHLYDEGIAGWWLDLTEPEGEPTQTVYKGGPAAKIHNVYSMLNTKTYYEMQKEYDPSSRPFILTRTGFSGIQRYGVAIWSGDINSDYETFAAHCPEALNTGLSGIPFWTNDSGGFLSGLYKNNIKDHGLLYQRWLQFSTFAPITRAHHVGPAAPYMFGPEIEESSRKYLQLRYRLLPYLYAMTWESHNTGAPIMRPLIYAYQNDPNVTGLKDQFLFGDALMVAPVLAEGITSRNVYFPEGRWIDYDYGFQYEGGQTYGVSAPQDRIPLFVRSGAIIPMAPAMQFTAEKPWDPITFDLYPDGASEFKMYVDDGKSDAFESQQKFTETIITTSGAPEAVSIAINESNKLFAPGAYRLQVHLLSTPTAVSLQGQDLALHKQVADYDASLQGAYWDAQRLTLYAKLKGDSKTSYNVTIKLAGDTLARPVAPVVEVGKDNNIPKPPPGGIDQIPHFYPPPMLPTRVEAENYDKGGEGVAFHTLTPNQGKKYRPDDAGIEDTTDTGGGYNLVTHGAGEWFEYTINVPVAGLYHAEFRTASEVPANLHLEVAEKPITGSLAIAATGGKQIWASTTFKDIYLAAGEQILRVTVDGGHPSLNYIIFTKSSRFQFVDNLDNFKAMYTHTDGVGFDTSNAEYFKGDSSRLNRTTTKGEEVVYKIDRPISAVNVVTYFWPGQTAVLDFKLSLSADGIAYQQMAPLKTVTDGNWREVVYRLEKLAGDVRFVKIAFPETEPNWAPQLAKVVIDGVSAP